MPSKSKAQKKLMAIAAHDPEFAKAHHITSKVAKEWNKADQKAHKEGKDKDLPEHAPKGGKKK